VIDGWTAGVNSLCNEMQSVVIRLYLGALVHVPQFGSRRRCYFKRGILRLFWVELKHLFPMTWLGYFP
jgi:hypothetical protein